MRGKYGRKRWKEIKENENMKENGEKNNKPVRYAPHHVMMINGADLVI